MEKKRLVKRTADRKVIGAEPSRVISTNLDQQFQAIRSETQKMESSLSALPADVRQGVVRAMKRRASGAVTADRVFETFHSPFRKRTTIERPTERKELNDWYRFYFKHEPIVGTTLELHTEFPLSSFEVEHPDSDLQDYFNSVIEDLNLFEFMLAMGLEYFVVGECLVPGTKITLSDYSVKNIEDINRGDQVITHTGQKKNVSLLMNRVVDEEIYKITISGLSEPLYVTKNHPILVYCKKGLKGLKASFVKAKDVRQGDFVTFPIPMDGPLIRVPLAPYVYENRLLMPITSIEKIQYKGLVYNLEVEDDHSYIANNIAVHNCFPFGFLDNYENPTAWDGFILLDPNFVKINTHRLVRGRDKYAVRLVPDDDLKKIVNNGPRDKNTGDLYKQIPSDIVEFVKKGQDIPLNNLQVSHFKRTGCYFNVRGESIISRVLDALMYRDKLMDAQYAVADRHITPSEFYFIGETEEPADEAELQDFRDLLAMTWTQPNRAIVSHHAVRVQWEGASGRVLPLQPEFDQIEKWLLTGLGISRAFLHGEGPCAVFETETLTEDGWKFYDQITEKDKIATYNPQTGCLEYHHYTGRVCFPVDDELVRFENKWIDHFVTPNHECWISEDDGKTWQIKRADKIKQGRMQNVMNWEGNDCDATVKCEINRGKKKQVEINIDDYLELMGYYVSEGTIEFSGYSSTYKYANTIMIGQVEKGKAYKSMKKLIDRLPISSSIKTVKSSTYKKGYNKKETPKEDRVITGWNLFNAALAEHLFVECGHGSAVKHIPKWVKNLKKEKLAIVLKALIAGDGCRYKKKRNGEQKYTLYCTISKQLADDVQEIAIKLGYPAIVKAYKNQTDSGCLMYHVSIMDAENRTRDGYAFNPRIHKDHIVKEHYKGLVYCFEVPNHLFIVRLNGKVNITKNTYANASVALDVLIGRYLTFRQKMEKWILNHVFAPLCEFHGIYDPEEEKRKEERRDRSFRFPQITRRKPWLPSIRWSKSNLRDDVNRIQLLERMHTGGLISGDMLLRAANINPKIARDSLKEEHKRKLEEPELSQKGPGMGFPTGMPSGPPMEMGGLPESTMPSEGEEEFGAVPTASIEETAVPEERTREVGLPTGL